MGWLLLGRAAGVDRVVCSLLIVTFLDVGSHDDLRRR
jgi:hypothetical protein